jgi:hypothetical protein
VGGDAGESDDGGGVCVDPRGDAGGRRGRQGHLLGEAAVAGSQGDAGDDPGDPVADLGVVDAVAGRGDRADEVTAEHDRELVRQHVPDVARGDGQVEAVDRCGLDLDQHLTGG